MVLKSVRLEDLEKGDLVEVRFFDASIGSSLTTSAITVPSKSRGIYVGSVGEPKHILLSQNEFEYTDEIPDVDYTAIPQPWATQIFIIKRGHVSRQEAERLLRAILVGRGTRRRRGIFQQRVMNHGS